MVEVDEAIKDTKEVCQKIIDLIDKLPAEGVSCEEYERIDEATGYSANTFLRLSAILSTHGKLSDEYEMRQAMIGIPTQIKQMVEDFRKLGL